MNSVDRLFPFNGVLNILLMSTSILLLYFLATEEIDENIKMWFGALALTAFTFILFSFSFSKPTTQLTTQAYPIIIYILGGLGGLAFLNTFFLINFEFTQRPDIPMTLMFVAVTIEELLFRIAFPRLLAITFLQHSKSNIYIDWFLIVLASNLIFGVYHALAYNLDIVMMATATIAGMFQSIIYLLVVINYDPKGEYCLIGLSIGHFWHNWSIYNVKEALEIVIILTLGFMIVATLWNPKNLNQVNKSLKTIQKVPRRYKAW
jgi:hypothetical protein